MANMKDKLQKELQRIRQMPKLGLIYMEICCLIIGINIAPKKRSALLSKVFRASAVFFALSIIVNLIYFVKVNFSLPFDTYVEAILLTFQLSAVVLKIYYFNNFIDLTTNLLESVESTEVLKDLDIFDLDLLDKTVLTERIVTILTDSWQIFNRQIVVFFYVVCMPVSYYVIRPYFQYVFDCYIANVPCTLILTYPSIVPNIHIGSYEVPSFLIVFMLLQTGPPLCGLAVFDIISVFVLITSHEVGLLQILRYLVKVSTSDAIVPQNLRLEYMHCCIRLYTRINKFHEQLENLFKYIILLQGIFSSILLCMLLYMISSVTEFGMVVLFMILVYFCAVALEIILYNVNAQRVESQNELLFFDIYDCHWYNQSPEFKYLIKLMLIFTGRPKVLSVGGFTNLSHKFLVQVFRFAGNSFLLLRNVNNK